MSKPAEVVQLFSNAEAHPPQIALKNVSVSANGQPLLSNVSIDIRGSGVTGLIGPNGAGKSVLLRLMTGLMVQESGSIKIDKELGPPALVFQRPILLRRTVRGNLLHALRIAGVRKRERTGRLAELLVASGLTHHSETPARALSGGQQQRLTIARALAETPKLLLLDEPTASLDPASTATIEALIKEIENQRVKVILVTHDTAQAQRLCEDVAFLHKGKVMEHTPANQFFDSPQSPEGVAYLSGELLL